MLLAVGVGLHHVLLAEAKVAELCPRPLLGEHDVGRLDVPMDDAPGALVKEAQGPQHVAHPPVDLPPGREPRVARLLLLGNIQVLDASALHHLGDDARRLPLYLDAQEGDEQRVAEARQELDLVEEVLVLGAVYCKVRDQHLDCHPQAPPLGLVHVADRALRELSPHDQLFRRNIPMLLHRLGPDIGARGAREDLGGRPSPLGLRRRTVLHGGAPIRGGFDLRRLLPPQAFGEPQRPVTHRFVRRPRRLPPPTCPSHFPRINCTSLQEGRCREQQDKQSPRASHSPHCRRTTVPALPAWQCSATATQ
mmetsp:Transcript_20645/g.51688  ORF Transcript_20645/g.51688 Transcript_20645/m.51688 type:complete len:307 (-) Transcript_20645:8-928(-)